MRKNTLPLGKQIAYACGMMGSSILINLINVILVYMYLPPANSGIPVLITQVVVFGLFNAVALITTGGRLVDAVYDPFIAQFSDRSKNPKGRRIPIMKWAIIPSLIFCCLVFYPLKQEESTLNILWLIITLIGFYMATTSYIIPYYALLPELARSPEEKVRLATWQSVGYVFGIGISSNAFNLTDFFLNHMLADTKLHALQATIFCFALLAAIFMAIPVMTINEKKYGAGKPSAIPMKQALRQTLTNKNFLLFIVADFSYFISVTIITSGLMFFITVLLGLEESIGNRLMMTMVLVSFVFYPLINFLAKHIGKKKIILFSQLLLACIFLGVYFLGKVPLDPTVQIYMLIGFAAIPLASLNILPNAVLAEIIEKDSVETGENKEAFYFAVRYFFVKIAQTVGTGLFAMLLICGKDTGHDLGVRLNGLLGFVLCLVAALIFTKFREQKTKP